MSPTLKKAALIESEWTPFRCRIPLADEKGFGEKTCSTLTDVYHVAHVPEACQILEDNQIKARLIGDESRLKRTRISVSWLSANTWAPGSIYGNVQFKFRWADLIAKRRVYWVEAMTSYSPHAYRFLITDRDLSSSKFVIPYDPDAENGPLRHRKGVWYWNGEKTSEFMIESNIALSQCTEIQFIKHRGDRCRIHGSGCKDRDRHYWSTGAQTLAYILGHGLTKVRHCFLRNDGGGATKPGFTVQESVEELFAKLSQYEPDGPITSKNRSMAVLRGALLLYGTGHFDEACNLAGILNSSQTLKHGLETRVRQFMKVPKFTIPN